MNLHVFCIIFLSFILNNCVGQKIIADADLGEWPHLTSPYLNGDGTYFKYDINYGESKEKITIVKSLNGKWKKEYKNADLHFTNADNTVFYLLDSILHLSWLGEDQEYRLLVDSYYIPNVYNNNLVFFQPKYSEDILVLNLHTKKTAKYENVGPVKDYLLAKNCKNLFLNVSSCDSILGSIKLINFESRKLINIVDSVEALKCIFDFSGSKFAALVAGQFLNKKIFTFDIDTKEFAWVSTKNINAIDSSIQDILSFDPWHKSLEVVLQPKRIDEDEKQNKYRADVKIWGYRDIGLPSNSKGYDDNSTIYQLYLNGKVIPKYTDKDLDYIKRISIASPSDKYLVYREGYKFYSFDNKTGIRRCISDDIGAALFTKSDGDYDVFWNSPRILAWSADGNEVFINDEFDVWRLSLSNSFRPKNLTNGMGRKKNIMFSLVFDRYDDGLPTIGHGRKIIFTALDLVTKQNGFYCRKNIDDDESFELLSLDNAMYWVQFTPPSYLKIIHSTEFMPQKARSKEVYVVAKSTATSSTNFFITADFRKFVPLTGNYPEKNFNWLTADLMRWKKEDGKVLEGILYKPENFDSTKKYPLIFYSYRKSANNLNSFLLPKECPGCIIDIPSYVSNGYLVFTPDIFFTKGQPGKDALSAVISAVNMLSEYNFIDKSKIGIQGCSFSGFTTNYIVTHTNIFAAACSASGLYDLISAYNSITSGIIKQSQFEDGPYQIGSTLWDDPEAYIDNSAIFNTHRLTTPFLMMGTTLDPTVPFNNSIEFFLAAKRLNKKVWLLQYDNQYHTVFGKEGQDFNVRMRQFFDHYLKGYPPAKWMTSSRNYNKINIGDNLSIELDLTGIQP